MPNAGDNTLSDFTVDAVTGQLRHNGNVPAGATATFVAADPSGKSLYVANTGDNNASACTINATTGALPPIAGSPYPTGVGPNAIAITRMLG